MLKVNISTKGMLNPAALTSISFNAKNTNLTEVSSVRLYYTADNSSYTNPTLLGTITTGPVANNYTFNINVTLPNGSNNF